MYCIKHFNKRMKTVSAALLLSFLLATPAFARGAVKDMSESAGLSTEALEEAERNELVSNMNQYRESRGLSSLCESESLSKIAEQRAHECALKFSHTRPQGGNVLDVADVCGEIMAKNTNTPVQALDAWEKSPSHNALILRGDYKRFGYAHYIDENGSDYCVVLFSFYNEQN